MLQVKNLTITQSRDLRTLVDNLSFHLKADDKMAVIGAEGNGKSSLLRLIHDPGLTASHISWSGEINKGSKRSALLDQETAPELSRQKPLSLFADYTADPELYRLASELSLQVDYLFSDRELGTFSGGELLKLRLLHLLMKKPDILLLDEPGNDLDLPSLQWLEEFIQTSDRALLYISHDEKLLSNTANSLIHLEQVWRRTEARSTVSRLGFDAYRVQLYAAVEKQNQMAAKEEQDHENKMKRYQQIRNRVDHELNTISRGDPAGARLLKKKMQSVKSTGKRFERDYDKRTRPTDLEQEIDFFVSDLSDLPSNKEILVFRRPQLHIADRLLAENLELIVKGPEHIGITGPNGCGKSTMLLSILDQLKSRTDIRVYYMPQDYTAINFPSGTAIDFLAPSGKKEDMQAAADLLGSMHFTREEMLRHPHELSGGQKTKLLYAKLRLDQPNVLLLDEPTRHLSPLSGPASRQALRAFGGAIISVSHDRLYLQEVCDRVLRLTPLGLVEEDPDLYQ
ncbi:MAG: ABC-F family ATP-binding cassette domain-containing protein [Clostridiaceae bacterium]|jgi:ATPase subunit of ABC transporter with duplicated ATPase domains|nr:ABC-F family ATP-binding cassette domain-containing protein [Clostridiaceae bacterium]